ncbi:MAG: DUF2321 domain-containing protein [Bdellovibrionales bacterium]|nr:DUF2321 domain-containing protein [Planctomycetales bacterium]MCB0346167.1 DUF2321 domain-containing protein [Bdellovibrionales bacterium]
MDPYDVQQVCLNGHQITDRYNLKSYMRRDFCEICGAETIHGCPKCHHEIRGRYSVAGEPYWGPVKKTLVPTHCPNCGTAFPWTESMAIQSVTQASLHSFQLVEHICSHFPSVAQQLRKRHSNRPTLTIEDEYDVQDLMHALLLIHFDDVRREEWTPSYAGGCSRVDFLLKNENIVVEVKKSRESLKANKLGSELIVDAERYRIHQDCKKLLCFVFDPDGFIANPRGLENDLRKSEENFEVRVLIVPKGH